MMKARVTIFGCLLTVFVLASLYLGAAIAQKPDGKKMLKEGKPTVESGKKVTSQGANPNIKSERRDNDPNAATNKTRGYGPYSCGVHIDNRTEWVIDVFVDGNYRGTVGSYGDLYPVTGNGPTTVYGIARFPDGSYYEWGPRVIPCNAGYWSSWTLNY